ncbi:hypothetical protein GJ744_000491 [Endocarpon pusillum]|uniref:Uncharacterized protein n=1 Tax=Endocarpon pusillum TaxID=364733 RepID=A0A8H7AAS0_9EURO|nr:hypothetical protein GJ744_000491 [Endocarpon pusillum]
MPPAATKKTDGNENGNGVVADDPLHYLPPGWTEEKYANATDEDWENQPDEVLERNMARMAVESAQTTAPPCPLSAPPTLPEADRTAVPPTPPTIQKPPALASTPW